MADPLNWIRRVIHSPADAVRWACVLEATAPKPGNVYPGCSFEGLEYRDFVTAADLAAAAFAKSDQTISQRMLAAVDLTAEHSQTNVNLGIVLLLGPLVAADEMLASDMSGERNVESWASAIAVVLSGFEPSDGQNIYKAINHASAGGLGNVDSMDVRESHVTVDIIEAMKGAADRDMIARQYATGFKDLIDRIVPLLGDSIGRRGDLLGGIVDAHLRLLAKDTDSLIARKNGLEAAVGVQQRAQNVDLDDPTSIAGFDDSLRSDSHELNPGTTADLIAAALYMLLRTHNH